MAEPIKAYLIDPFAGTITEVVRPSGGRGPESLKELYKLLDCDCIDAVRPEQSQDDAIYVDDLGLDRHEQAFFFCDLFPYQQLAGKGLWVGSTRSGNDASPKMTLDHVRQHIFWVLM
ncbi:hypothetical protein NK8_53830 (plasmid) [Caballeronia sp. NK8]|uniref:DUF3846 domain-containing protein n=1 Tax=Caballeronia sp. NK8 TaxID=140098 RepID=UPI001BB76607|nr:hypothetical protein [Caballeronia sp. NK8]BCQ27194.1 hypothetical protein NK8_53830 [Caballeronia sp. NK8]